MAALSFLAICAPCLGSLSLAALHTACSATPEASASTLVKALPGLLSLPVSLVAFCLFRTRPGIAIYHCDISWALPRRVAQLSALVPLSLGNSQLQMGLYCLGPPRSVPFSLRLSGFPLPHLPSKQPSFLPHRGNSDPWVKAPGCSFTQDHAATPQSRPHTCLSGCELMVPSQQSRGPSRNASQHWHTALQIPQASDFQSKGSWLQFTLLTSRCCFTSPPWRSFIFRKTHRPRHLLSSGVMFTVSTDGYTIDQHPKSHWGPRNSPLMFRSQGVWNAEADRTKCQECRNTS